MFLFSDSFCHQSSGEVVREFNFRRLCLWRYVKGSNSWLDVPTRWGDGDQDVVEGRGD
jgi:hypothetical protein